MPTDPTQRILPRKVKGWETNRNGTIRPLGFSVLARSPDDAVQALADSVYQVAKGRPYRGYDGQLIDTWCICTDIVCSQSTPTSVAGWGNFELDCYHEPITGRLALRPTPGRTVYELELSEEGIAADIDADGHPFENCVEEPFDPPMLIITTREVLVATWFETGTDWFTTQSKYRWAMNHTNDKVWHGADPECVVCRGVRATETQAPSLATVTRMFQLQARFAYMPAFKVSNGVGGWNVYPGWHDVRPMKGRRHLDLNHDRPNYAVFPDGQPHWLTPNGFPWQPGGEKYYHSARRYTPVNLHGVPV